MGSVSACISVAALYTTGVIKGGQPVVVLVNREPLSALAWLLEGARLLRRRREKGRSKGSSTALNHKSSQDKEALDQVIRILALLERVLRTTQTCDDLSSDDVTQASESELLLPDLQALQDPLHRGTLRSAHSNKPDHSNQRHMQLWPSVLEARLWLETELELLSPKITTSTMAAIAGPDDDIITELPVEILLAHAHLLLIKALAQTHSISKNGVLESKAISALGAGWSAYHQSIKTANVETDSELTRVAALGQELVAQLQSIVECQSDTSQTKKIGFAFWTKVEATLPESHISLAPKRKDPAAHSAASSSTESKPENSELRHKSGSAPDKALRELDPVDVDSARAQENVLRPSLLNTRPAAELRKPSVALDTHASSAHNPRKPAQSPRKLLHRAISNAEVPSPSLLSKPSSRSISRHAKDEPAPSFAHHFGNRTISGSRLTVTAKRPSSVVSDSPSLLFGEEEGDDSLKSNAFQDDSADSSSGRFAFPSMATVSGDLASQEGEGPNTRRPRQGAGGGLRRVTSMYGEPSLTTQVVHSSGSSSTAYGHGSDGVFDPTASLREGQYRRRRADSNASVATGTSIFSTQAIRHEQSFSPPDGHALGTMAAPIQQGPIASSSLRQAGNSQESSDSATPLLTERLERKLAESYASQRQPSGAYRKDTTSINSRMSNASRRTGLSALRSPSFFGTNTGGARKYHLGIFPKSTPSASLATTSENVEQQFHMPDAAPKTEARSPTKAETVKGKPSRTNQRAASGTGRGSALNSLRAVSLNDATAKLSNTPRSRASPASSRLPIPEFGQDSPVSGAASPKPRAFSSVDPTALSYASNVSPETREANAEAAAVPDASDRLRTPSPKPSIRSPNSPRRVSPPGSVRSVRFDLPEVDPAKLIISRGSSRNNSPPLSPRPHSYQSGASSDLDPALARAEGRSKLKTSAGCENCGVLCINAPVDRKGRKFCSRECRIDVKEKDKKAAKAQVEATQAPATAPQETASKAPSKEKAPETNTAPVVSPPASSARESGSVRSIRSGEERNSSVRSIRSVNSLNESHHSPRIVAATGP